LFFWLKLWFLHFVRGSDWILIYSHIYIYGFWTPAGAVMASGHFCQINPDPAKFFSRIWEYCCAAGGCFTSKISFKKSWDDVILNDLIVLTLSRIGTSLVGALVKSGCADMRRWKNRPRKICRLYAKIIYRYFCHLTLKMFLFSITKINKIGQFLDFSQQVLFMVPWWLSTLKDEYFFHLLIFVVTF